MVAALSFTTVLATTTSTVLVVVKRVIQSRTDEVLKVDSSFRSSYHHGILLRQHVA